MGDIVAVTGKGKKETPVVEGDTEGSIVVHGIKIAVTNHTEASADVDISAKFYGTNIHGVGKNLRVGESTSFSYGLLGQRELTVEHRKHATGPERG